MLLVLTNVIATIIGLRRQLAQQSAQVSYFSRVQHHLL
jgi:hypothetical protein